MKSWKILFRFLLGMGNAFAGLALAASSSLVETKIGAYFLPITVPVGLWAFFTGIAYAKKYNPRKDISAG